MFGDGDRSFSAVVQDVVGNIQNIMRSEIRLAQAEVKEETIKAGKASGILGAGAVFALYAVGFLLLGVLFALELAVAAWLAALIVMVLAGITGAVLISAGRQRLKRVHPRPEQAIQTMKENVEWAKHQVR